MRRLLIALDYDNTYTADPEFWLAVVAMAQNRNHTVICATMRCDIEKEDMDPRLLALVDVEFTASQSKRQALQKRSIYPDIWIDDYPEWIVNDAF